MNMSLLDKYAELVERGRTSRHPNRLMAMRLFDPNFASPDIFYTMDEIGRMQILRKYDKATGNPLYLGTYHIMYKTQDLDRFCLIMKRIENEWRVPKEYIDPTELEPNTYVIAEYYPGTHGRIYLRGLSAESINRIIDKYERKTRKKLTLK